MWQMEDSIFTVREVLIRGKLPGWCLTLLRLPQCEPDQGVSIKNLSQDIRSYSYTYENVGTYRATFLITNANYKHDDSQVYTVVVNVTD